MRRLQLPGEAGGQALQDRAAARQMLGVRRLPRSRCGCGVREQARHNLARQLLQDLSVLGLPGRRQQQLHGLRCGEGPALAAWQSQEGSSLAAV